MEQILQVKINPQDEKHCGQCNKLETYGGSAFGLEFFCLGGIVDDAPRVCLLCEDGQPLRHPACIAQATDANLGVVLPEDIANLILAARLFQAEEAEHGRHTALYYDAKQKLLNAARAFGKHKNKEQ